MVGKPFRLIKSPLAKTAAAWGKLPTTARVRILKAGSAAMLFVAISYRTFPKLPAAIHEALKACGAEVGNLVRETVNGVADGFVEAVRASIGVSGEATMRMLRLALGGLTFALALFFLVRHYRTRSRTLTPLT